MRSYCSKQKVKKKRITCDYTCRRCRSVCKRGGAAPCLLFPHHQCTSECLEAEGFHQKLVLASASHSPAVAGGSISGPNPIFFQAGEGVGCRFMSAGNELIADTLNEGGWVDGEVIVYNRFANKAVSLSARSFSCTPACPGLKIHVSRSMLLSQIMLTQSA